MEFKFSQSPQQESLLIVILGKCKKMYNQHIHYPAPLDFWYIILTVYSNCKSQGEKLAEDDVPTTSLAMGTTAIINAIIDITIRSSLTSSSMLSLTSLSLTLKKRSLPKSHALMDWSIRTLLGSKCGNQKQLQTPRASSAIPSSKFSSSHINFSFLIHSK